MLRLVAFFHGEHDVTKEIRKVKNRTRKNEFPKPLFLYFINLLNEIFLMNQISFPIVTS
jgi:hypothetical protein